MNETFAVHKARKHACRWSGVERMLLVSNPFSHYTLHNAMIGGFPALPLSALFPSNVVILHLRQEEFFGTKTEINSKCFEL